MVKPFRVEFLQRETILILGIIPADLRKLYPSKAYFLISDSRY